MQKRWTALVLAALMLVTTSCGRTTQPQEDESSSASNPWTPPASSSQAEEPEPVKEPPAWETGRTVEHLPDNYNGLELPIQGATGYTSVELPLWADPADQEAAATAVEEWEKAEEERKRLEEALRSRPLRPPTHPAAGRLRLRRGRRRRRGPRRGQAPP